ncbi:MAG: thioredoxin family protein [Actinomycetota bacterium]
MAVSSTMRELGTEAPPFSLGDVRSGEMVSSDDLNAGPLLVMFICNHCPYVKHVRPGLVALGEDYADAPIDIVAISSNDAQNYSDDAPGELARVAEEAGYGFPVLFDETQEVARAYGAVCTPDFFLFDADRRLVYRGQFDDSRPGREVPVTGRDLRAAMDSVLAGDPPPDEQRPSVGCSIKWKPGNEPVTIG